MELFITMMSFPTLAVEVLFGSWSTAELVGMAVACAMVGGFLVRGLWR